EAAGELVPLDAEVEPARHGAGSGAAAGRPALRRARGSQVMARVGVGASAGALPAVVADLGPEPLGRSRGALVRVDRGGGGVGRVPLGDVDRVELGLLVPDPVEVRA